MLDEAGQLDNTLVIVTSDNGMSFPRQGQLLRIWNPYAAGDPLGRQGQGGQGGRRPGRVRRSGRQPSWTLPESSTGRTAPIGPQHKKHPRVGQKRPGRSVADRGVQRANAILHRATNLGYPQRCLRTPRGFFTSATSAPTAGPPATRGNTTHRAASAPCTAGYHDIDACPSLTFLVDHREEAEVSRYFHLAVDKRPAEELFDVINDPGCLKNLAGDPAHEAVRAELAGRLEQYLRVTGDPRVLDGGEIFETYPRYSPIRQFPPQ